MHAPSMGVLKTLSRQAPENLTEILAIYKKICKGISLLHDARVRVEYNYTDRFVQKVRFRARVRVRVRIRVRVILLTYFFYFNSSVQFL